jgi:hypothetical protein
MKNEVEAVAGRIITSMRREINSVGLFAWYVQSRFRPDVNSTAARIQTSKRPAWIAGAVISSETMTPSVPLPLTIRATNSEAVPPAV